MSVQYLRVRTHGAYNGPSLYPKSQGNFYKGASVEYNGSIYSIYDIVESDASGTLYTLVQYEDNNIDIKVQIDDVEVSNIDPLNYINKTSCRGTCFNVNNRRTSIIYSNQLNKKLSSGLFTMNKKFISQNKEIYSQNSNMKYWHQSSDRLVPSISKKAVGVDIKHNSYDRYLNKLKGKNIKCSICI